jgi:phage protein U
MFMMLGPFVFTVPTYSVEALQQSSGSRIAKSPIIGSHPTTHMLGPDSRELTLESTFHPQHMNTGGLAMLSSLRAAAEAQTPLMMVSVVGMVFGRWIIERVDEGHSRIGGTGVAQKVTVKMSLSRYVPRGGGGPLRLF